MMAGPVDGRDVGKFGCPDGNVPGFNPPLGRFICDREPLGRLMFGLGRLMLGRLMLGLGRLMFGDG